MTLLCSSATAAVVSNRHHSHNQISSSSIMNLNPNDNDNDSPPSPNKRQRRDKPSLTPIQRKHLELCETLRLEYLRQHYEKQQQQNIQEIIN